MTRKHFERLAELVRTWDKPYTLRVELARALAGICEEFNPAFDQAKFYSACNVLVEVDE